MHVRTILKGFEAFKFKFEPFEKDAKHSNANSNHPKGIQSIQSIQMNIRTIQKGFQAFHCNFQPCEKDSMHFNANSIPSN